MTNVNLKKLPQTVNLETEKVLKALVSAHRRLAELKGVAQSIPNQAILISSLSLQEAKDSSAVENIITTHDELYKHSIDFKNVSQTTKEVRYYSEALRHGFDSVSKDKLLTTRHILAIHEILEQNTAGYRKVPGTQLINDKTRETIYLPPQEHSQIVDYMSNLEHYINNDEDGVDPLIKMAVIHYQFESIHPFYDGNGRTGRIINILYLVLKGLLDNPILYMSRYIIKNRDGYYKGLKSVGTEDAWEAWILYILEGIEVTAMETHLIILKINKLFLLVKHRVRDRHKFYSQDLVTSLFMHPYTKIEYVMRDLGVTRLTATKYLNLLVEDGILHKEKIGRNYLYINRGLFDILSSIESL